MEKYTDILLRLSVASLLILTPACSSDDSNDTGSAGTGPGTGGSGMGGSGGGGALTGSGGLPPATGGIGPGSGGVAPATGGASLGTGGAAPATGGSGNTSTFTVNLQLSTAIETVGIATWSLSAPVESATIEFGRDPSSFEFQAPADLEAADHRTLLLGMKPNTTYYVRVTATGGGQTYVSQVASIETGYLPNGLPTQAVTDSSVAFIFDRDGDVVWAYDLSDTVASTCTHARMSLDGKYMWIGNFGNTTTDGALMRVSMDGLGTTNDYSLPGRSHDFAILPNEHIAYFARDNGGADMSPESILELDPTTGATTLIYSELTDFGDLFDDQGGHTNQINYVPALNALAFSMYFIDTIALVSYPEGQLLASFGGDNSTFSTMSWTGQHGHDVYADHIDVFNNNGTNGGASVLRFQYDLQAQTATQEFDYSPGVSSPAFGDVKELPNGNYYLTYSTAGVLHEIDSARNLLREVETSVSIGYVEHRGSLYGPPPPYGP